MEGLGTLDRLGLEGLLLFMYPNLLSSESIYRLGGGREIFRRVLQFPLRFTAWRASQCYLVFASFFHTLLAFILLLIFDEYGLE